MVGNGSLPGQFISREHLRERENGWESLDEFGAITYAKERASCAIGQSHLKRETSSQVDKQECITGQRGLCVITSATLVRLSVAGWGNGFMGEVVAIERATEGKEEGRKRDLKAVICSLQPFRPQVTRPCCSPYRPVSRPTVPEIDGRMWRRSQSGSAPLGVCVRATQKIRKKSRKKR